MIIFLNAIAKGGHDRTPVENFDKYTVFTTLSLLRKETGLGDNLTGITIHLKNSRDVD